MNGLKDDGSDDDEDDEKPDPREKSFSLFTNAENVKPRLRKVYVPVEKDLYKVQKLSKSGHWDATLCKSMYYEYYYYNGNGWTVVTSAAKSRLDSLRCMVYKAYKKRRCKKAFTDEELKELKGLFELLKKFNEFTMGCQNSRGTTADHKASMAGTIAIQICDKAEVYERIMEIRG